MESLVAYSIPFGGLKDGMHQFDYQIDNDFFSHFADTPITEGAFKIDLDFDKKPDVIAVQIKFNGTVGTACDRCLEQMKMPVTGEEQLLIKFSDDFKEEAEVVYLPVGTHVWNAAQYIYEFICLALPITKTHDLTADSTCDTTMLSYLEKKETKPEENQIWDQLKNIKLE